MRNIRSLLVLLVVVATLAAACTPSDSGEGTTTTSTTLTDTTTTTTEADEPLDPDGFYLMLMWHQHQPQYPKDADGVVTRPWARVHATKDYYDMAALVAEYPDVHVTFNLTPVLLLQLEELADGTKDVYWVLSEVPADELTEEQRAFILQRFFDVNPGIIARFPRFQELADKRSDGAAFTDQDYRDLQVLFNLAWTDPSFLEQQPLASLVDKGGRFTEEDKEVVFAEHLRIIGEVIPIHRRLWEEGQIEVTTTPLAHPILPLIADTALGAVGDPTALMPQNRFQEIPDAREQVVRGLDTAERLLGRRPIGMWPGEGAVAQLVMSLFSGEGVEWVATGEDVLAKTLDIGSFTRDSNDTVQEADVLYRPWDAQLTRNPPVTMFFRDVVLADRIGFEYSGMDAEAAAADFMARLENIEDRLDEQGATGPRVVSVVVDGENAWEHYENDGIDFLRALYRSLSESDFVRTITPGEYLEAFGDEPEPLGDVFPSAWFSPNFATWIGEEEEAWGWDYLWQARQDYEEAVQSGTVDQAALEAAFEKMLFAQGSDWFWWYGSDQESGNDDYFDAAYRELLGQMYDALGVERPAYVAVPIIPETTVEPDRSPGDLATITVDNSIDDAEWAAGGGYTVGGELIDAFGWSFDKQNMYLRVDFAREVLGDDNAAFEVYLGIPSAADKRGTTLSGSVLGFFASHVLQWRGTDPVAVSGPSALPVLGREDRFAPAAPLPAGFDGDRIEFAVPLADLGPLEVGDRIRMRLVNKTGGGDVLLTPTAGPGLMQVPDISDVEQLITVSDPAGDDHGPGTYAYPLDGVFASGSYDLTGFSVGVSGDDVVFTLEVLAPIQNPWNSPTGLSIQTFDVYVDTDPGAGTGARLLIPGRNAALAAGDGWEYGITVEGWDSAVYVAGDDGTFEETKPTFATIVIGDKGRVVARIPRGVLGDGDPAEWGYAVAVMSQEGFPSSGVRRVRDVQPSAEQWRIGGGTGAVNATRILDVLWPESGGQEALLGGAPEITSGSVDDLGPDDFGTIPLNVAG